MFRNQFLSHFEILHEEFSSCKRTKSLEMSESSLMKSFEWVSSAAQIHVQTQRSSQDLSTSTGVSKVESADSRTETGMLRGGLLSVPRSTVSPPSDWLVLKVVEQSARCQQQKVVTLLSDSQRGRMIWGWQLPHFGCLTSTVPDLNLTIFDGSPRLSLTLNPNNIQHFEVEGLKLEAPVLNSRCRVGLGSRAVENESQRFVIRYDFEVTSQEVHTEVMTTPCDCQCLVLDLRVKPSHTREG